MDTTTAIRPRSWRFAFDVVGDAKTADGWMPASLRWLVRAVALGAVCLIARLGIAATPILAESEIAIALYAPLFAFFLAYALLSPAVYAMMFRLRARRGLRSALVSIALYAPIFGLAANAAIVAWLALAPFAGVGAGASDASFGNWTAFALVMGVAASALTALARRVGMASAPPPAITASRFYAPTETAASIAALAFILSAPLWAA